MCGIQFQTASMRKACAPELCETLPTRLAVQFRPLASSVCEHGRSTSVRSCAAGRECFGAARCAFDEVSRGVVVRVGTHPRSTEACLYVGNALFDQVCGSRVDQFNSVWPQLLWRLFLRTRGARMFDG